MDFYDLGKATSKDSIKSLRLVCRRFNDVILTNPLFWNDIILDAGAEVVTEHRLGLAGNHWISKPFCRQKLKD